MGSVHNSSQSATGTRVDFRWKYVKFIGYLGRARTGELDLDLVIAGQYQVPSTQCALSPEWHHQKCVRNPKTHRAKQRAAKQENHQSASPDLRGWGGREWVESWVRRERERALECWPKITHSWVSPTAGQALVESSGLEFCPQTLALFFRLCSVQSWVRLVCSRCVVRFWCDSFFVLLLLFRLCCLLTRPPAPALPLPLFTRCRVVCVTFRIHLQQRAQKKIHNGDKQPLCKARTSTGTSMMTMTGWHSH